MINETIKNLVKNALGAFSLPERKILLDYPADFSHGDFSSNIAMVMAKEAEENPKSLAEKIAGEISKKLPDEIEKVEVAGAGFINFYLSKDFFAEEVKNILKDSKWGEGKSLQGKNVLFEYTDPNPFKPFHIGHLMANAVGEALASLAESQGANTTRVCYGGDVGLHVAKTIWGMIKNKEAFPHDSDVLTDKVKFLGDAYVFGNRAYEEEEAAQKEIKEINKKVFALFGEYKKEVDQEIKIYYEKGRAWSLEKFEELYKKLGTHFDRQYFESQMASIGLSVVEKNIGKVFKESEGAVVFKGEDHGLHTRVFITSEKLPTYEAKELGFFATKAKDFPESDLLVTITANEQNDYFRVVSKALSLIDPQTAVKFTHISHGILRFASGKMSSRKGNVITGEGLIGDVFEDALRKIADRQFSEEEKKNIAEVVAVGAIKFTILRQKPGKDIVFDQEKSLSFEGDSGPYLLYSLVRALSLLEKAKEEGVSSQFKKVSEEISLVSKLISRLPNILERAWQEKAPQLVIEYLLQTASAFNAFYAEGKIVDNEDEVSPYKVAVTEAFAKVMSSGLKALGIKYLNKM